MDKEVRCPWCERQTIPEIIMTEKGQGKVKERRCPECGKVLAAYLADEGDFMRSVRKYEI
jgi:uncharacterized Zn finger protein